MRGHWLSVFLFYLFCSIVITWPLVTRLDTHLAGFGYGDSLERAHHVWWLSHALRTGQPLFWLPNLGWPDGVAGITLLGHPLQHIPAALLALVLPLPVADNLSALLQMALMGPGMYALGLQLTRGSRPAALVGGLVFMAAPHFQAHLAVGHNIHHSLAFAPLFVLALLRLREAEGQSRRRWFVAGALSFAFTSGGHALNSIYMLVPLATLLLMQRLVQRDWRGLAQTLLMCLAGALVQMIFILPVAAEILANEAYTGSGGNVIYSLDLLGIVTPSLYHPLYGQLEYTHRVLGSHIDERSAWIGVVAGALALVALARGQGRFWFGLALLSWVLALGPLLNVQGEPLTVRAETHASFVTLPLAFLQDLPLMSFARTPGRFAAGLALALACLATLGTARLLASPRMRKRPARVLLVVLLPAAIGFDYQWFWPFPTGAASIAPEIAALGQRSDIRAVLDVPLQDRVPRNEALWLQTAHQLPLIGGHVTRGSPVNPARLALLEQTLDPALLQLAGADVVIVHLHHAPPELVHLAEEQLGTAIYRDSSYAVHKTPATTAGPPPFLAPDPSLQLDRAMDIPLYAAQPGWLDLAADLVPGGRDLEILLDGVPLQRWSWSAGPGDRRQASLPVQAGAWHMLTIMPTPACLRVASPAMICPREALDHFTMRLVPLAQRQARFDDGVTLRAGALPERAAAGDELVLRLHWQFDKGREDLDVRLVHVFDGAGQLVAQSDEAIGALPAGSRRSERIALPLPERLPPGTLRVLLGWYRHPHLSRLALLEPADSENDLFLLGSVELE